MSSSGNVMSIFEIWLLSMKRGLLTFQIKERYTKKCQKRKHLKDMQGGYTKESLQKNPRMFQGDIHFQFRTGILCECKYRQLLLRCTKFPFLSSSYLLAAAISLFSCSSSTPRRRCQREVLPPLLFKPPTDSGPVRTRRGGLQ